MSGGFDRSRSHDPQLARCKVEDVLQLLDETSRKLGEFSGPSDFVRESSNPPALGLRLDLQEDLAVMVVELRVGLVALPRSLGDQVARELPIDG